MLQSYRILPCASIGVRYCMMIMSMMDERTIMIDYTYTRAYNVLSVTNETYIYKRRRVMGL